MATISDKRLQTGSTPYYLPDVVTQQDYYSFGAPQPGDRTYVYLNHSAYRYGFNGKENDDDVGKGVGNQQDYGMRIYDPRVGRFFSVDPLSKSYPFLTPYAFAENDVIRNIDFDGLEKFNMTIKDEGNDYRTAIIVLTSLDASKGLQVSINGADPIDNFKYKVLRERLDKVYVGMSPQTGEQALMLNGKEISKINSFFSLRTNGQPKPDKVPSFSAMTTFKLQSGFASVGFISGSVSGNLYKNKDSEELKEAGSPDDKSLIGSEGITGVNSLISNVSNAILDFTSYVKKDMFLQINIQSNEQVSNEVAKKRGDAIISKLREGGVDMDIKISYTKGKRDAVSIVSQAKME